MRHKKKTNFFKNLHKFLAISINIFQNTKLFDNERKKSFFMDRHSEKLLFPHFCSIKASKQKMLIDSESTQRPFKDEIMSPNL